MGETEDNISCFGFFVCLWNSRRTDCPTLKPINAKKTKRLNGILVLKKDFASCKLRYTSLGKTK